MIVWFGEEDDSIRQVKINWLKLHFQDNHIAKPLGNLDAQSLIDARSAWEKFFSSSNKEKLIISGHGNSAAFMGYTPLELYEALVSKGLTNERFDSIYLLGCNLGLTAQNNSEQNNFLKKFGALVKSGEHAQLQGIKVYGPRGLIRWYWQIKDSGAFKTYQVTDVKIEIPHLGQLTESYSFDNGLIRYEM